MNAATPGRTPGLARAPGAASAAARTPDAGAAVPVRDWINVGTGAPPRLMAFDQALVWWWWACSRSAW